MDFQSLGQHLADVRRIVHLETQTVDATLSHYYAQIQEIQENQSQLYDMIQRLESRRKELDTEHADWLWRKHQCEVLARSNPLDLAPFDITTLETLCKLHTLELRTVGDACVFDQTATWENVIRPHLITTLPCPALLYVLLTDTYVEFTECESDVHEYWGAMPLRAYFTLFSCQQSRCLLCENRTLLCTREPKPYAKLISFPASLLPVPARFV